MRVPLDGRYSRIIVEIRDDGTIMRTLYKIYRSILSFSLLFGTFLLFSMPLSAQAGFFSSVFGNDAFAQTNATSSTQSNKDIQENSQTMALLQANVSSASILQDKNNTDNTKNSTTDNTNMTNIISDTSLLPATGPLGVSDSTDITDPSSLQTSVYVVRKGDSLTQIAQMFGISVDTILWANDMKKGDKLNEGDVLFILPVSGLEHTVTKGQTLQSIAKLYKVDVNDIIQDNDITLDTPLVVGDTLIIPNAEKSAESDKPIKNLNASIAKDKLYYEQHPVQILAGYFIDPVPGYRLSQGIHDNNAVDLAIGKGTPIHAAAAGTVILARKGYNGGFGNVVIIQHPNGVQTLYAHQSKIAAHTGDEVYQGEVIGYVGSTGHSTGPHLHFEVHGAQNPGADGSWAN